MTSFSRYAILFQITWALTIPALPQVRPEIMELANGVNTVAITSSRANIGLKALKDSLAIALAQAATAEELVELTDHASPTVRTTALFALLGRPEKDSLELQELVPRHFHDTAGVQIEIWGEYKDNWRAKAGDVFLYTIGGYTNRVFWENDGFALSDARQQWLDSVFICSLTSFEDLKEHLFWRWEPSAGMYPCIRPLAASGQSRFASAFLAKYQNEADIELITAHLPAVDGEWGNHAWLPFRFFRHPRMFDFLEDNLDKGWRNAQYQGRVAEYKNRQATVLLDTLYARIMQLDEKEQFHPVATLARTIEGNYDSVYATLCLKIITKHSDNPNVRVPENLWLTHADTLYRLSLAWKDGGRAERERSARMLPDIIRYLETHNRDSLIAEIVSRIQPGLDMRYYVEHPAEKNATMKAYQYIYQTQNPDFVDPLIDILKREPLAKNRFFIAKLLHEYGDSAIDERLARLFRERPELAPGIRAAEEGGGFFKNLTYYADRK